MENNNQVLGESRNDSYNKNRSYSIRSQEQSSDTTLRIIDTMTLENIELDNLKDKQDAAQESGINRSYERMIRESSKPSNYAF